MSETTEKPAEPRLRRAAGLVGRALLAIFFVVAWLFSVAYAFLGFAFSSEGSSVWGAVLWGVFALAIFAVAPVYGFIYVRDYRRRRRAASRSASSL